MDNDCTLMHRNAIEHVDVRESYKPGTSDYRTSSTFYVVKPLADKRSYEFLEVGGDGKTTGARFLLVSDPEAVFAAACLNMQAGYFDDPPDVPGFAHWLEHAVHLVRVAASVFVQWWTLRCCLFVVGAVRGTPRLATSSASHA